MLPKIHSIHGKELMEIGTFIVRGHCNHIVKNQLAYLTHAILEYCSSVIILLGNPLCFGHSIMLMWKVHYKILWDDIQCTQIITKWHTLLDISHNSPQFGVLSYKCLDEFVYEAIKDSSMNKTIEANIDCMSMGSIRYIVEAEDIYGGYILSVV